MKHFSDSTNGQLYEFDDDVVVEHKNGIYLFFTAAGEHLTAIPETLQPCDAPEPRKPTSQEIAAKVRFDRNHALALTDWYVNRHRDEVELKAKTSITADQYRALQTYRQALRDLPTQKGFPNIELPAIPGEILALIAGVPDPE